MQTREHSITAPRSDLVSKETDLKHNPPLKITVASIQTAIYAMSFVPFIQPTIVGKVLQAVRESDGTLLLMPSTGPPSNSIYFSDIG